MIGNLFKLGAASVAAAATLSYYTLSARKSQFEGGPTIPLKCECGKFTGRVKLPKDPKQAAGANLVCHCTDCFKWASQVAQHGGLMPSQGDELLMVYKGMLEFDHPELVRRMRLYPKSTTHRYMTKCCGTSIYNCIHGFPVAGLSGAIVADKAALRDRAGDANLIMLRERKKLEEFSNNPNAYPTLPSPSVLASLLNFYLRGFKEMGQGPIVDDLAADEIVFPEGK